MDKLAAVVALVALGGVAWMAFGQQQEGDAAVTAQLDQLRADNAALADRLDKLLEQKEKQLLAGTQNDDAEAGPGLRTRPGAAEADGEAPVSLDERLARIEERLAKQDERATAMGSAPAISSHMPMRVSPFGGKRFLRSADDAAKALELDDAQKSDMERILQSAKHELDRLYDTQDDNGDTLAALQKDMHDKIKGRKGDEPFKSLMSDVMKLQAFKQKQIPGSDETFGQAERRIHQNAMRDIRRGLSPDQQREWDNSHTGGLLPGAGGTTVSTVMVGEPAGVFVGGTVEEEEK